MNLNEYQRKAQRTSSTKTSSDKIENALLGLFGEGGEVADQYKKYMYQGHELDKDHMVEEIGDILWYIAELASGLGVTLDDVAEANINKLYLRYPEGFDIERSVNREKYMRTCGNCKHFLIDQEECVARDIVRGYDDDACERFKL